MSKQKAYSPTHLRGFSSGKGGACGTCCDNGPSLILQTLDGVCELVQVSHDDCGNVTEVITKVLEETEVKSTDGSVLVKETTPGCFDLCVNFPEIPMDVFVTDIIVQSQPGPNGSTVYQFCAVLNNGVKIPYGPVLDTIALVKSSDGSVNVSGPDADGCFDLSITPPPVSSLTVNGTIVTHVSGDGTVTTFDFCACPDVITTLSETGGVVSYTNEDGVIVSFDICAIVAANCNSPLVVNPDGSLDYTDNAGNVTSVPGPVYSSLTVVGTVVTHVSGDGVVTSFDFCNCPDILTTLSVNASVITYTNEDGIAVSFDICQIVDTYCPPVITTLTLNAAGNEFTYVNEDGAVTVVPFCPVCPIEVITTLVNNGDNTYTYTNEDGLQTVITIPQYINKDGSPIPNGAQVMQQSDFANATSQAGPGDFFMGQNANGDCLLFAPPEIEQDQKICAVRIVNNPVGGENVYSFEYDVCDIDGNVVNTLVANNVPVPTFIDKNGGALSGEIEVFVPSDFVAGVAATGDVLLAQDVTGACKTVPVPVPANVCKSVEGAEITEALDDSHTVLDLSTIPTDEDYATDNDAACLPDDGLRIGKATDGTLRQQPPIPCNVQNSAFATQAVNGPAFTALLGAGGVIFDYICSEIQNESCYKAIHRAIFRSNFNFTMPANETNYWVAATQAQSNGTGNGTWSGTSIVRHTHCSDCISRFSTPVIEIGTGETDPGENLEFCKRVRIIGVNYVESGFGGMTVGANVVSHMAWGCQGDSDALMPTAIRNLN